MNNIKKTDKNQVKFEIKIGTLVGVVQKHHQKNGEITKGIVKRILTNSSTHPYGIKVELESGIIGRVKEIY